MVKPRICILLAPRTSKAVIYGHILNITVILTCLMGDVYILTLTNERPFLPWDQYTEVMGSFEPSYGVIIQWVKMDQFFPCIIADLYSSQFFFFKFSGVREKKINKLQFFRKYTIFFLLADTLMKNERWEGDSIPYPFTVLWRKMSTWLTRNLT